MFINQIHNLLLEVPLYDNYKFNVDEDEDCHKLLKELFFQVVTVDTFCLECKQNSTFKSLPHKEAHLFSKNGKKFSDVEDTYIMGGYKNSYLFKHFWNNSKPITLAFNCQRNNSHNIYFIFYIQDNSLFKIGQYPSKATIDQVDLQKYRKILGQDRYKEFNTGVGLASHGVGIGSFVYLRRVFEYLIEESHFKAMENPDWDEELYKKHRMNEKIKMLESYLPQFLVEHRELYGILSKGVHELDEKICLGMFPNVKTAIEIILDQKIHDQEIAEKIKNASRFIQDTAQKLKA